MLKRKAGIDVFVSPWDIGLIPAGRGELNIGKINSRTEKKLPGCVNTTSQIITERKSRGQNSTLTTHIDDADWAATRMIDLFNSLSGSDEKGELLPCLAIHYRSLAQLDTSALRSHI